MPTKLNKTTYEKMISENIDWVRRAAKALGETNEGPASELGHIIGVMKESVEHHYPEANKEAAAKAKMDVVKMLRKYLAERVIELRTEIATEQLAYNTYKEGRAKAALAELTAIEQILRVGDYGNPE